MAQNREIDDLPTAAAAAAAAPSGCGSFGPGHGPDTARLERGEVTAPAAAAAAAAVAVQVVRSGGDVISLVNTTEEERKTEEAGSPKRALNRCTGCRKRVGLTGFRCRCGDLFCSVHRYSDRHHCSYDYKAAARAAIARENPLVRAAKILKV